MSAVRAGVVQHDYEMSGRPLMRWKREVAFAIVVMCGLGLFGAWLPFLATQVTNSEPTNSQTKHSQSMFSIADGPEFVPIGTVWPWSWPELDILRAHQIRYFGVGGNRSRRLYVVDRRDSRRAIRVVLHAQLNRELPEVILDEFNIEREMAIDPQSKPLD